MKVIDGRSGAPLENVQIGHDTLTDPDGIGWVLESDGVDGIIAAGYAYQELYYSDLSDDQSTEVALAPGASVLLRFPPGVEDIELELIWWDLDFERFPSHVPTKGGLLIRNLPLETLELDVHCSHGFALIELTDFTPGETRVVEVELEN